MEQNETGYNGWTNYETWLVNLWMDNEEPSQEYWYEKATEALENNDCGRDSAVAALADAMWEQREEAMPTAESGIFADLLNAALGRVDWRDIARHWIDNITVYSAGWNMPGCAPDSEPHMFLDAGDALEHVKDAAKDAEFHSGVDLDKAGMDAVDDAIDEWKADKNGEFGLTFGRYHYFVAIV